MRFALVENSIPAVVIGANGFVFAAVACLAARRAVRAVLRRSTGNGSINNAAEDDDGEQDEGIGAASPNNPSFTSSAGDATQTALHEALTPEVRAVVEGVIGEATHRAVLQLLDRTVDATVDCTVPLVDVLRIFVAIAFASSALNRQPPAGRRRGFNRAANVLRTWTSSLRLLAISALRLEFRRCMGVTLQDTDGRDAYASASAAEVRVNGEGLLEDLERAEELRDVLLISQMDFKLSRRCASFAATRLRMLSRSGGDAAQSTEMSPTPAFTSSADDVEALDDDLLVDCDEQALIPALWDLGVSGDAAARQRLKFLRDVDRLLKRLHMRNRRAFARHVTTHAVGSMLAAAVSTSMIFVATIIESYAPVVRSQIELALLSSYNSSEPTSRRATVALLGLELARATLQKLTSNAVDDRMQQVIVAGREETKLRLHFAFARLPVGFFTTTSADRVDEIMYYPNDLEGVEVQLVKSSVAILRTGWAAVIAIGLQRQSPTVLLVAAGVTLGKVLLYDKLAAFQKALRTAVPDRVSYETMSPNAIAAAAERAQRGRGRRWASDDCEGGSARDQGDFWFQSDEEQLRQLVQGTSALDHVGNPWVRGAMISPGSVPEYIELLRPGNNDLEQVVQWYRLLRIAERRSNERRSVLSHVKRLWVAALPYIVSAAMGTLEYVAPLAVAYGTSVLCRAPMSLAVAIELQTQMSSLLTSGRSLSASLDTAKLHAHKAHVVEMVCDPANWEQRNASSAWLRGARVNAVEFTNVSFAYPTRPDRLVVRNFRLQLPFPDACIVAIVGDSGIGKSTIFKLLLRQYRPQEGTISLVYDGDDNDQPGAVVPLEQVDLPVLRRLTFSYAAQFAPNVPSLLPECTVAETIAGTTLALHRPPALDRAIVECATVAQCHRFISELSERYNTPIGGLKSSVSGGEMTRLNIARALFAGAQVMLADEPTTGLDPVVKANLIASLKRHISRAGAATRCIVCVTHDEALISAADVVVRIEGSTGSGDDLDADGAVPFDME